MREKERESESGRLRCLAAPHYHESVRERESGTARDRERESERARELEREREVVGERERITASHYHSGERVRE